MTKVAGLILAGGASQRMGRPKARLELDGRSFVELGVDLLRAAGCAPIVITVGAHPLDDLELDAVLVHNREWSRGPLSSLQLGLRRALELEPHIAALLVHHVERPRVRVASLRALLTAYASEPGCIWQPTHAGVSGHPLIWPRASFDALLGLDPTVTSARALTRGSWAARRRKLELDDPGVLDNVDTPAAYARIEEADGSRRG